MRWTALLVAGFAAAAAGCQLAHSTAHNLWNEPVEYLDQKKVTKRLRQEGEAALAELRQTRRRHCTDDFAEGFVDGYADFLEHGGNTAPPAVPPLKYRRGRFLNPDGHARVHDYFAGFQSGAETAAGTGKRQFLTVPILLADPVVTPPVNARQIPADECGPTTAETLPKPRPAGPTAGLSTPSRPLADLRPADPVVPPVPVADPPKPDPGLPKLPPSAVSDLTPGGAGRSDFGPTEPGTFVPVSVERVFIQGESPFTRSVVPPLQTPYR